MKNKNKGYIYLHRTLLDNSLWTSSEKFGLRDAWIDLLLRANYEDSEAMSQSGDVITVHRGQILTSQSKLAERWGWSRMKVHRILDNLQAAGMIYFTSDISWGKGGTLITVRNYSYYQAPSVFTQKNGTSSVTHKTAKSQKSVTLGDTQGDTQVIQHEASNCNGCSENVLPKRTSNEHRTNIERTSDDAHLNEINTFYKEINEEGGDDRWF